MANSGVVYREVRFVIEDELTQAYCLMNAVGDSPLGVQGWHHKTFPASMPVDKILEAMFTSDRCILWPQKAPQ